MQDQMLSLNYGALEMRLSQIKCFFYLYNKIIIMISSRNIILYNVFSLFVIIFLLPKLHM